MQESEKCLLLQHTLQFSVSLPDSPHKMHLHGENSIPLAEMCNEALKSRELRDTANAEITEHNS